MSASPHKWPPEPRRKSVYILSAILWIGIEIGSSAAQATTYRVARPTNVIVQACLFERQISSYCVIGQAKNKIKIPTRVQSNPCKYGPNEDCRFDIHGNIENHRGGIVIKASEILVQFQQPKETDEIRRPEKSARSVPRSLSLIRDTKAMLADDNLPDDKISLIPPQLLLGRVLRQIETTNSSSGLEKNLRTIWKKGMPREMIFKTDISGLKTILYDQLSKDYRTINYVDRWVNTIEIINRILGRQNLVTTVWSEGQITEIYVIQDLSKIRFISDFTRDVLLIRADPV